eukprot:comp22161_c0_seq2/m.52015 comp22161_c0_seq2/g.52015  ORF comp22161_c0_seq2/g.52015 comp22161_c0_seq2/m.52015 type:complete len:401 (-) comp22161_c0_seq2:9-1211(-)
MPRGKGGLNPGDDKLEFNTSHTLKTFSSFETMGLRDELLRGVFSFGFEKPSGIQARGIMPIISGRDVIAQAQSGTGKTATFSIGLLQKVETKAKDTQALVISPTRELAEQTTAVVSSLGDFMNVRVHACIGGKSVGEDIRKLEAGVHVVSGTPGRVLDMMNRGKLNPRTLKIVVLDEADEMLSLGFKENIYDIFRLLPAEIQVVLISATLPRQVLELTTRFMTDPVKILVEREHLSLHLIRSFYIDVGEEEYKFETLTDLYDSLSITQSIIFVNSRKRAENLTEKMREHNFTVTMLHGDLPQAERDFILNEFRSGKARVLITTDVLARGIDIHQVSLVINYDLPANKEVYLHRIGRSGRFGRRGVAINFVTEDTKRELRDLERAYKIQIDPMPKNIEKYY